MHRNFKNKFSFQVWLILPIIFFLICLFLVTLPLIENPVELSIAVGILLAGVPVYYFCVAWKNKPKALVQTLGKYCHHFPMNFRISPSYFLKHEDKKKITLS